MSQDPRQKIPAPAAYARAMLRRFGTTPEMRERLLEGSDFDEARLREAGSEVTLLTLMTINSNLCRLFGEQWPLDVMEAWSNAMQGALEVAVRSAPTLREAIEVLGAYGQVRGPQFRLRVARDSSKTRLICAPAISMEEPIWRAYVYTEVLVVSQLLASLLEEDLSRLEFEFTWPAPNYAPRLRATLPGAVKFERSACAICLPNALCTRVSPFADPALFATAIADLERSALKISQQDTLPTRVANLVRDHRGRLSEDQAARLLGVSRRTLVRRLADEGLTFRMMLDSVLKERASKLLEEGRLSRDEMAEALGFADPTSFSRACRRWFGGRKRAAPQRR
jgi:AraC-like DNA-binding protein